MGEQSIRTEWEWSLSHKEGLEGLLGTGFRSDFTVVLGPNKEEVKVHKIFLQTKSRVLDSKILEQGSETPNLELEDIEDVNTFKMMLKYFYTGTSGATILEALPLLKMAMDFEVAELKDQCDALLEGEVTLDNALPLFEDAMKYGHKDMILNTLKFICRNSRAILKTPRFSSLRLECLVEIIQQDDLTVKNEMEVFEAVYRWGEVQCQKPQNLDPLLDNLEMRNILCKTLKHIRFPLMDQVEFALHVATKSILSSDEALSVVLSFLVPPQKRHLLPQGRFISTPRKYCGDISGFKALRGGGSPIWLGRPSSGVETICFLIKGTPRSLNLKEIALPKEILPDPRFWKPWCGNKHEVDISVDYSVGIILKPQGSKRQDSITEVTFDTSGGDGYLRLPFANELAPNVWYSLTIMITGSSYCSKYFEDCTYSPAKWHVHEVTNFLDSPATIFNLEGGIVEDGNLEIQFKRETPEDPMPITAGFIHHFIFDFDLVEDQ